MNITWSSSCHRHSAAVEFPPQYVLHNLQHWSVWAGSIVLWSWHLGQWNHCFWNILKRLTSGQLEVDVSKYILNIPERIISSTWCLQASQSLFRWSCCSSKAHAPSLASNICSSHVELYTDNTVLDLTLSWMLLHCMRRCSSSSRWKNWNSE